MVLTVLLGFNFSGIKEENKKGSKSHGDNYL